MIRKATTADIPAIRDMASVAFPSTYREILSPGQLEYMMDMMYSEASLKRQMTEAGHDFYICDGRGYVSFRREGRLDDGTELFHLEKLYVLPQEQGSGLGRRLFGTVVDEIRKRSAGKFRIELNVNRYNSAVTFYENLGMTKSRQGDFPIGNGYFMNDYIMAIDF